MSDEDGDQSTPEDPFHSYSQSSKSSTDSINRRLDSALLDSPSSLSQKRSHKSTVSSYDFEESDDATVVSPIKKAPKKEDGPQPKFSLREKDRRPVYHHKWAVRSDDEEEEDAPISQPNGTLDSRNVAGTSQEPRMMQRGQVPIYRQNAPTSQSRIKNVKEAHQILESGEHDDIKHDLEYLLSDLNNTETPLHLKSLSALQLAKRCVISEVRQFIRSEGQMSVIFKAMADAPSSQAYALCASAVLYLMARDTISMRAESIPLRLLSQLLQIQTISDPDANKVKKEIWKAFEGYVKKAEQAGRNIVFDLTEEHLTPSNLILEALVYILTRCNDDRIKTEVLNLGILQFVVLKVEKLFENFNHKSPMHDLMQIERCFRILESSTVYHKKNQAFLISHRTNILIQTCGKILAMIHENVNDTLEQGLIRQYLNCLALLARVLMNLAHENELASTKLGQLNDFLSLSLASFTYLAPKYASDDKKYDMYIMMCSLLVNLVERCNANRRKVMDMMVKVYNPETKETSEQNVLEALTKLFNLHEEKARNIDEDLDKELAFEEAGDDDEEDDSDDGGKTGRLDRGKIDDMSETEMVNAVQNAMSKASAHMEDSVVASYLALLVGCLLQQNEEKVDEVKALLPKKSLSPMVDQLQRFLEFMKIATSKSAGCRSMERIIDLLESLE